MTNALVHSPKRTMSLTRALSIPIAAALLAVVLLNTRLFPPGSVSEVIGGEFLRRGLRTIAVVFGLSCFAGGTIGVGFGSVIAQLPKFSSAAIQFLRFAQWMPYLIWCYLVPLALVSPGHQLGRYFYIWTICIPAVALGACFKFLYSRSSAQYDWKTAISETARLSVVRALYVSVVLAVTVWMEAWISWPRRPVVHFFLFFALATILVVVNWIYKFDLGSDIAPRKKDRERELHWRPEGFITTGIVVLVFLLIWELLSAVGGVQVSLREIFKAGAAMIVKADTWNNISVSITEILSGLMFNALFTFVLYVTFFGRTLFGQFLARLASLAFIAPIVLLPIWLDSLAYKSLNFILWTPSCVVVFCIYPFIRAFWETREQLLLSRFLLAAEAALPYAFSAMVYGQSMNATAGLGFAMVVAGATLQTEIGLAVFLITFLLLVLLMLIPRTIRNRLAVDGQTRAFSATSNNA